MAGKRVEGQKDKPLKERVVQLLGRADYRPLDKVELSKALGLHSSLRRTLRDVLAELELEGAVARIRKDRYVLPEAAQLVAGRIEFHRNGTAHLIGEKPGQADVLISAENSGTAMHGDQVMVRLEDSRGPRLEGTVIRIVQRKTQRIVGTLQKSPRFFYVVPDDPRMPHDVYVEATPAARIGDKVVVRLDVWESRHVNPEGTIVEVLGPADAPGVDIISIIKKHELPERFPEEVLEEADRIPEQIEHGELRYREDCRRDLIVTIDPDDAKDFDDAIHVEQTQNGWRLQVHIADVSHYVSPGTALDREARIRGNSTYLVDRVIPMLPERLSNGICSLKPAVDRLTFAAFIDFDADGRPKRSRFAKAVIRSAHRFTYKQAFAILSERTPQEEPSPRGRAGGARPRKRPDAAIADVPHQIRERLHVAWELASLLRKNRFAAGSLDLDFPEVKVRLDEDGRPATLERIENDISHQLIEEFMLAANEAVARTLRNRQIPSVYRVHEKPDPVRLKEFREIAGTHGIRMGSPEVRGEIQRALRQVRGQPEEFAVKMALLRRLMRARYATDPLGHYGLAKSDYTHFTSPIRRYADLLVHRSLEAITASDQQQQQGRRKPHRAVVRDLGEIAEHISKTERTSAEAESESVQLKKMEFFERQLTSRRPQEFRAVVTEVRSFGLVVDLPEAGQGGVIHVSTLGNEFFQFDPVRMAFFSRKSRKRFALGDELMVLVSRVDRFKRQVDFIPVASSDDEGARKPRGERSPRDPGQLRQSPTPREERGPQERRSRPPRRSGSN